MRAVSRFIAVLGLALAAPLAAAEPARPPAWDLKLGFSYLATTGNSDTSSAGFDARYVQEWLGWGLEATAAAVRATRNEKETAEHFNSQVRGRRKLGDGTELTLGLRGERNRFAGIDARTLFDTSLLQPLVQTPEWQVHSLTGVSWTREDPLGDRPERENLGGLVQLQATGKLSSTAELTSQTTWFPDLEGSDDYRLHGQVSVQAALNKHLGLRVGYDLKYDNEPVQGFNRMDTSTTASLVVQLGRK